MMFMQAILYCDKLTDCIPLKDCPEALLPICNVPLLEYLLHYIEEKGFRNAVLLTADSRVRNFADGLHLRMSVQYARSLASLHANVPTLLLRRLCVPEWDMGELLSLCHGGAVRVNHADGTPALAELHPQGSVLLEPERMETAETSVFRHINTPADYREIQMKLLKAKKFPRIGAGVRISDSAVMDDLTIVGNDCIIGENVRLERCVLGDGVQIGRDTVLTDCVICRKSLIDRETTLRNAVIPENTVQYADARTAQKRRLCILPEDGICDGLPRWNSAGTALRAGAAMTALGENVAVGYGHENGKSFAIAVAAGAVSQGGNVWYSGECALSQLMDMAHLTGCQSMLWVQGSHVLQLKPFNADGFPLDEQQCRRVGQALDAGTAGRILSPGNFCHAEQFRTLWIQHCEALIPRHDYDIAVSCANARLRTEAQGLFGSGTGMRITLSLSDDGTKITAFSSETGMIRHEQLILLSLFSMQERGEPLVIPEDFHPSAEAFAVRHGGKILRFHASDPAVRSLYRKQGICTDGIKLAGHVLRGLSLKKITLKQAVSLLPEICTVQHELSTTLTRQNVERLEQENADTRIRIVMPLHSKLVKLRVHADSVEAAAELCTFWEKKLHAQESEHS